MERLLNVRETAEFLNVSEMTVRRWTNAGLLRCYRIGPKRERRFKLRELEEYLAGAAAWQKVCTVPLGLADSEVPDGAHLSHLYHDGQEALGVGVPYVMEGLRGGETVLVVAHEAGTRALLEALEGQGLDIQALRDRGKLHLSGGMPTPEEQAAYIASVASSSTGRFRLLGDMNWAKDRRWSAENLRGLEDMTNRGTSCPGRLILCQYSLAICSGQEAMMVMETHNYAIYKGRVQESPYFGCT